MMTPPSDAGPVLGPPAIADCPEHQGLLRCATNDGIDTDALRDLLWRIRAPRDLMRLARISDRIIKMIKAAKCSWDIPIDPGIARWPAVLNYIVSKRDRLGGVTGEEFDQPVTSTSRNPFRGRYLTHGTPYPSFWHDHPTKDEKYLLLQAQLLFAFAKDAGKNSTLKDYEGCTLKYFSFGGENPYDASLAVRELSNPGRREALLDLLPVEKDPIEFAKALDSIDTSNLQLLNRRKHALQNYFEHVYGLTEKRQARQRTGTGGPGGGAFVDGWTSIDTDRWLTSKDHLDPDDPYAPRVTYKASVKSKLSSTDRKNLLAQDICPDEFDEDEETVETDLPEDATKRLARDPSGFETIISGAANHIEKANQLNWFAYNVPTTGEITTLLDSWFSEVKGMSSNNKDTEVDLETILLGLTMLATGASFEDAQGLHACSDPTDAEDFELCLILPSANEGSPTPVSDTRQCDSWKILVRLPQYRMPQNDEPDMTEFVTLPDLFHAGLVARKLLSLRGENLDRDPVELFPRGTKTYRKALRENLGGVDATGRTTIAKLPNFLFAYLVREADGDVADACFSSRHWHELARVPSFYATPSLARIQRIYVDTAKGLRGKLPHLKGQQGHGLEAIAPPVVTNARIGNRACPTRQVVKDAISRMKQEIDALKASPKHLDQVRLHNVYSLYTLEFFSASVGARGSKGGLLHLDDLDEKTGLAVLTEKTTRCVWLPKITVAHLKHYYAYLRSQTLVQPIPDFGSEREATCFLVIDGTAVQITPTRRAELQQEFYPFPAANHFRRIIRNWLREDGCPASVVKAWMSHASRGEEVHHLYSSFSHGSQRQVLRDYLEPALEAMGFEPRGLV